MNAMEVTASKEVAGEGVLAVTANDTALYTKVRDSAKFIASQSSHVRINNNGVEETAQMLQGRLTGIEKSFSGWKEHSLHPHVANEQALEWIFVLDTLNFSFWTEPGQEPWTVLWQGHSYTGYWALCAALQRALAEGRDITSAAWYSHVDSATLAEVFRSASKTPVPMLETRQAHLHAVGKALLAKHGGRFANAVQSCHGSAAALLDLVVRDFPCYRDCTTYRDTPVWFLKRAQILVADLWACFEGRGPGAFDDIDQLTMFADYRVPQLLCHLGVLEYDPALLAMLARQDVEHLPRVAEAEIRGCSIWAVELIKARLAGQPMGIDICDAQPLQAGHGGVVQINAVTLDFHLWDYAKAIESSMDNQPIMRLRTPFY